MLLTAAFEMPELCGDIVCGGVRFAIVGVVCDDGIAEVDMASEVGAEVKNCCWSW